MKFSTFVSLPSLLLLLACQSAPVPDTAQYWQRASASDMAFQQGPKAQQMLDRDIARCVTELRELERLGAIQNAIPADLTRREENVMEERLRQFDDTNRAGYLFAEHKPYGNFETCMDAKGWDRVEYVPFDVADRAEKIKRSGNTHYIISDMIRGKQIVRTHNDYNVNR